MKAILSSGLILGFGAAAVAAPTPAELGHRLLGEALTPVIAAIEERGGGLGIGVEQTGTSASAPLLAEYVADFLLDQGHQVWILDRNTRLEPGQMRLELVADEAVYETGDSQRGFLGLAPSRTRVEARLAFHATLNIPDTGELLYEGAGAALWTDWVKPEEAVPPTKDDLLSTRAQPRQQGSAQTAPPASGWKERAIALGLLTGVIIVYFNGAS